MTETKIEERRRTTQPNYQLTQRDEIKFGRIDQQMTKLMKYA